MRFFSTPNAPTRATDLVCRQSWWGAAIASFFTIGLACSIGYLAIRDAEYLLLIIVAGSCFAAVFFLFNLRATLRPGSWLLRYDGQRLLIRFRSYSNWRLPADDLVVAELEPDDVVAIRRTRERRKTPGSDSSVRYEKRTLLDIETRIDLAELEAHLKTERSRRIETKSGSYISRHYPVQVVDGHTIRVEWNHVRPGIRKVLRRLGESFEIGEDRQHLIDTVTPPQDMRERELQILELIEQGRDLEAIRSVRKLYGCSLREAKAFVDGLKA